MNFLNKAKEQANNIINHKGESPMGNPFINKNTVNTQTAPKAPTGIPTAPAPKAPGAPSVPNKPGVPPIPGKPGMPPVGGVKPPMPGTAPKAPGATPAPTTPAGNPFAKPEAKTETSPAPTPVETTPVVEEKKENVVEPKVETASVENVEAKTEEVKAETKEEEKKPATKKKGGSRKKAAAKTEEVKDAPTANQEAVEIVVSHTELSYAEACQAVRTHFVDPEWDAAKAKFEEISKNIHISNDMNKAQLHDLLSQVANLRDEVYSAYTETKTLYEHLTDKENGLIERTKRTGSKGANAEERKLTGTLAIMNYVDPNGNKINLYEVLDETRIRFNFLKGIIETIEFKKAVLLTMLSSLKSN